MRERVVNGRDNIVRRGYSRRIRDRVYCIWKETKKWDSLACRVRPVWTTLFRIQYLFSSDREHCVRRIAVCYPVVMSPTRIDSERNTFWGLTWCRNEEVPMDGKDLSTLAQGLLIPILSGIVSTAETTNPRQKNPTIPFR